MVHRVFSIAAAVAFVAGCGQSEPPSPARLVSMGRFDEAIELATQMVRANPRDAETFLYRGRAYHCRNEPGDLPRAIADFTQAISLAPAESEAYYSRALAYRDLGKPDESAADQREARKFDPRLKEAYAQVPEPTLPSDAAKADATEGDRKDEGKSEEDAGPLIRSERRRERPGALADSAGVESGSSDLPLAPAPAKSKRDELLESLHGPQPVPFLLDDDPWSDDPAVTKAPAGQSDADVRSRSPQRGGETGKRAAAAPSEQRPLVSPWQLPEFPSEVSGVGRPAIRSPYQGRSLSPFPQRAPRPTGIVEDRTFAPARPQPRTLYNNPYSVPAVQPPVAHENDLNP